MKTLDITRLRADTPACEKLIHFNNAGSSLMPAPVYQAVLDHLALEQAIGGYDAEDDVCPVLEDFYDAFAALLNCDRSEIAYVENATRAWDMAFYSLPLKDGDRILTVEAEYVSNFLAYLHQARRRGLEIDVAPCDARGGVHGEWHDATAQLISDPGLIERSRAALRAKYGWQIRVLDFFSRLTGRSRRRGWIQIVLLASPRA